MIGGFKDLSDLHVAAADSGQPEMFKKVLDVAIWRAEQDHLFKSDPQGMGSGSDTNKSFPVYKVKEIKEKREEEATEEGWFCPLFMRAGEITLFGGEAKKSGKTTFYSHMLKCVHDGKPFMRMPTIKSGALILTEQGSNILEATTKAGIADEDEIYFGFYKDLAKEEWPKIVEGAVAKCLELGVRILVIDTFTAFARLRGSDENQSGEIIERMEPVLKAARVHGLHVSVLHHTGKDGEIRGSSAFQKDPDVIWVLKRPGGDHGPNVRALEGLGRYDAVNTTFNIALENSGYVLLGTNSQIEREKAKNKLLSEIPVADGPEGGRRRTVVVEAAEKDKSVNVSKATIQRALEDLVEKHVVLEETLRGRGNPLVLWRPKHLFVSDPDPIPPGSDTNKSEGDSKPKTRTKKKLSPEEEADLRARLSEEFNYACTESAAENCLEWVKTTRSVSLDIETYGRLKRDGLLYTRARVRLIQLHSGGETWFIDCDHVPDGITTRILEELVERPKFLHNAMFDVTRLYRRFGVLLDRHIHDTMIASRVARAGEWERKNFKTLQISHGLEDCIARELGFEIPKDRKLKWGGPITRDHLEYTRDDVAHLKDLHDALRKVLEKYDVVGRYEAISARLPDFIGAAVRGVHLDTETLQAALEPLERETAELESRLNELAPDHPEDQKWVWNNTSKETTAEGKGRNGALRALELLGIKLKDVQDQTLLDHRDDHELVHTLYLYRKASNTLSRYSKWVPDFYENGRMYPQPKVAAAVTGRVLYSDPNAQGVDKRKTDAFRKCIRSPKGRAIVKGDFAQQELRIAAYFSKDQNMLSAFSEGRDIYQETAVKLVGRRVDKDDPARQAAKRATLGFLYGLGTEKYRQNVYKDTGERLSKDQAEKDRKAFRSAFPTFYRWQRDYGTRHEWETRSVLGWRRVVGPDHDGNPKYTDRLNGPIQSTAGDILYLTLEKMAADPRPGVHFLLSVHDELVLECPEADAREVALWLKEKMRSSIEDVLGKDLGGEKSVEVSYGPSWAETTEEV